MPRHDPSHELAERIAEKEGQRKRIDDTLAAMMQSFGEKPLSAIADQMKAQAERRDGIDLELVELRQSYQTVAAKASQPDHFSERDKLMALAGSVEPQKRYEARARIATGLRGTIESISCMPDKTTRINFPTIEIPSVERPRLQSGVIRRNSEGEKTITSELNSRERGQTILEMGEPDEIRTFGHFAKPETLIIRKLLFSIAYDPTMKTQCLMTVDPPLDNSESWQDMNITGFAPSLLIAGIVDACRPEGSRFR